MNNTIKEIHDPLIPTILMSMHSEYVQRILSGEKVIEYRKRFFKDRFQAFVYTSGKGGGIELFMKCAPLIKSNAETLAKIGQAIQNDSFTDIYDYFKEKDEGCIIPIIEIYGMTKIPISKLRAIYPDIKVPQSYFFLNNSKKINLLNFLLNEKYVDKKVIPWNLKNEIINQIVLRKKFKN